LVVLLVFLPLVEILPMEWRPVTDISIIHLDHLEILSQMRMERLTYLWLVVVAVDMVLVVVVLEQLFMSQIILYLLAHIQLQLVMAAFYQLDLDLLHHLRRLTMLMEIHQHSIIL
jgi:hypothetical protein|tara:strand:+ start:39 stop:383 length:345 start_codon:yes stop_codon:yes gene_type:complete